ncbi:alpha/beta hydrolase [Corynebacterium pelargi]|uniref:Lysophospholipase L2 n=1 Tax=Corynebacterium pelargi TaxID=1471400 RepID=A0A410W856_9CORY|nr:alpha/beta hydrolase [Corynebacterium pelargi]QAU52140.1 lysophospholipase L2 [Corynebacterium pelargi]GGG69864.1 lysophospholipase [Corynebacterium pelargi]
MNHAHRADPPEAHGPAPASTAKAEYFSSGSSQAAEQAKKAQRAEATPWYPDALGPGFQARTFNLGQDPDGEGHVAAVLVRYLPAACDDFSKRPALLIIHGMTDYFFHQHIAKRFHQEGFAVYGIDLRKSGRAHLIGQRWHYVSDMHLYFQELNAVAAALLATHPQLVPVAHSTGGLIASLWMDDLRTQDPARHRAIPALILNSPWLDMQFPPFMVKLLRKVLHSQPGQRILRGGFGGKLPSNYGRSLHASAEGEWHYDLHLKPIRGHKKYPEWIKAVDTAQQRIHAGAIDVGAPVLTLHAKRSYFRPRFAEEAKRADTVLDVEQIRRRAPLLGQDVTVVSIEDAVHDVFLSSDQPRSDAIQACLKWLKELGLPDTLANKNADAQGRHTSTEH